MVHDQYLIHFLMENYPWGSWRTNVRLGRVSEELARTAKDERQLRAMNIFLARCDALVLLPDKVVIIETISRAHEWFKIGQLEMYERLFKVTEEFREHWDKPVEKILVTPLKNPLLEAEAFARGIRVVTYTHPAMSQYWGSLRARDREPRLSGVEVKKEQK